MSTGRRVPDRTVPDRHVVNTRFPDTDSSPPCDPSTDDSEEHSRLERNVAARDPQINLAELRSQLTTQLGTVMMVGGGLLIWARILLWVSSSTRQRPVFPIALIGLLAAVASIGFEAQALVDSRPVLARHLIAWGLDVSLLVGMVLFQGTWLPFLGLIPIFINGLLVRSGRVVTAAMVGGLATWLSYSGARAYPLIELWTALILGVVLSELAVGTLSTTLEWAWTMQQRADQLLSLARDRQGELRRVLKSLEASRELLARTQSELEAAQRRAERARILKEQFAANISHELRTPLNLVLGFGELLYLSPEVYGAINWTPRLRRAIYQIYRNSRHLLGMIDDILDLSRFEMTGFALNTAPTSVQPLIAETVEIAQDLFRNSDVRLAYEVAPDLPVLEIDRTRIRQVLLNLLNNAARFTKRGLVLIEAKREGSEVVVSVSDTGIGIPDSELPNMFQEFHRLDTGLNRNQGGSGLGLAISKHFVEAHGGRIWVRSPSDLPQENGAGPGSVFAFAMPDTHVPYARLQESRHPVQSSGGRRAPVLVVDPDIRVVSLVERHTGKYPAVQVERWEDLPRAIEQYHPRAIVENVLPWSADGEMVVPAAPVPVIRCSLPTQAWMANALNVHACLTKPVTMETFVHLTESLADVQSVLVVDDERGFCQLVEQMFQVISPDIEVCHAYDGEEGLTVLRACRPDLLLLDLRMPRMDGFTMLEQMRQDPDLSDTQVVLLTVSSFAEDILAGNSAPIVVRHGGGLSLDDTVRCLGALIEVLEPHYDPSSESEPVAV